MSFFLTFFHVLIVGASVNEDCLTLDVVLPVPVWENKDFYKGKSVQLTQSQDDGGLICEK